MTLTRRMAFSSLIGAIILSGCRFYRDPPPVVIGGNAVSPDEPIMAALRASSEHQRFVAALEASGLDVELEGIGPFTVFAPTDSAFDGLLPQAEKEQIASDPDLMKEVLLGHIVPARLKSEGLKFAFPQLNGKTKVFALNKQVIVVEGEIKSPHLVDMRDRRVDVTDRDAIAANGIIHVVENLLLPESEAEDSP